MKITTETLQGFKQLHTWAGLLAGLLLFIAFYAGALTVFREDIARWQFAETVMEKQKALSLVSSLIDETIAIDPRAGKGLMISLPGDHAVQPLVHWRTGPEEARTAGLDPQGHVSLIEPAHTLLSVFIDELHRNAGIPGITGEWLMGLAALIYGVALVSGVVIFLPRIAKNLFALRLGENLRRYWLDIHNCLGMLSLPFHIMFALTGAVMALHDPMLLTMNKLIYPETGNQLLMETVYPVQPDKVTPQSMEMLPAKVLLDTIESRYPAFDPAVLIYSNPNTQIANLSVIGHLPGYLAHQTMVVISPISGEILGAHLPGDRPDGIVALTGFRALHFGDFGGQAVAWIYLALGLAGAVLFYTGNLLWLETRRHKKEVKPKSAHLFLAKLTVAVCLGCGLAILLAFLIAKQGWILEEQGFHLLSMYWCVMGLSVCWCIVRPVALAARELLLATGLVALLILLSQLFVGTEAIGVIEYCCLVAALVYFYLARLAHQRAKCGVTNSVWAVRKATS